MVFNSCRISYKGKFYHCSLFRTGRENLAGAIALMDKDFPDDFYSFEVNKLIEKGVVIEYYTAY